MTIVWNTLVNFFGITFAWAPDPIKWVFFALVVLANILILSKIIAFILDMIPFL